MSIPSEEYKSRMGKVQYLMEEKEIDLVLVYFDDYEASKNLDPPLTTIINPSYKIGEKAAEVLINKIEGREDKPRQITFSAHLVKRGSSVRVMN